MTCWQIREGRDPLGIICLLSLWVYLQCQPLISAGHGQDFETPAHRTCHKDQVCQVRTLYKIFRLLLLSFCSTLLAFPQKEFLPFVDWSKACLAIVNKDMGLTFTA